MGSCIGRRTEVALNAIVPTRNFGENNALLDRWSEQQVRLLSKKFNEYKTTEGLDFEGFGKLFKETHYLPKAVVVSCFHQFAIQGFAVINFRNFCLLIAQVFLSSKKDKAELIFKIFDGDNDGTWTEEEVQLFNESYKKFLCSSNKTTDLTYNLERKIEIFRDWCVSNVDFDFILKPFELIPSPQKEKSIIFESLLEMKVKPGNCVYLLLGQWWETWRNYVNYGKSIDMSYSFNKSINIGDRPVAIDNSSLLHSSSSLRLKPKLKKDKDFVVISEKIWNIFQEWYGGGPIITRKYIGTSSDTTLELYPPILTILPVHTNGYPLTNSATTLLFSQCDKFSDVLEISCKALNRPSDTSRLWVKIKNIWVVSAFDDFLGQSRINEEEVLLETFIVDRHRSYWPREQLRDKIISFPSSNITTSSSNSEDSKKSEAKKLTYTRAMKMPGVVGLANLGNTCYFNCIIQALVHTPLLQEFFATSNIHGFMNKKYSVENSLAFELGSLSKELWGLSLSKCTPIRLYLNLTQRFPMFEGKEQHDCHEFLSMLLDSLHEELRREGEQGKSTVIIENPENKLVEITESDRQWKLLQGSQGSIITDICAGQTKTTLTCSNCQSKRILFEIFTNLSLPIPITTTIPLYITVVPLTSPITKIAMMVSKHSLISEVLAKVIQYSGFSLDTLKLIEANVNYNISELDSHSSSTLNDLGISHKAELLAFEVRTTIESCEIMGKRALRYESSLNIGDQIDILQGNAWVTGRLHSVKKNFITEYLVEYDYQTQTEWKSSSQISEFRSHTSSTGCKPFHFLLLHTISYMSRKVMGFPLILSIGSWYTFEDLHSLAMAQAFRMAAKDTKSPQNCFKLLVLDPVSLKCGLCRNYNCSGCPLLRNKTEVRTLGQSMRRVCIAAEWAEDSYSGDVKLDPSVLQVREKEKEINKPIDITMCLDAFTKEETVEMECEKCKNKTMKIMMEIWRAPDILILSLKRFTYSNGVAEKIQSLVTYPFSGFEIASYVKSIDVAPKTSLSTSALMNSYDLYAVVLHTGNMYGGHYTTLIKMQNATPWILFDDESTLELRDSPESSSILSNSYLLFYRRRRFSSSNVINLTYNAI